KILNPGIMAELAYTGRKVSGLEAQQIGIVNRTYPDQETMMAAVQEIAEMIASKSPLVIRGTKENLLYSRDHTVDEGLNYVITWNAGMISSDDLTEAFQAKMMKRQATFED
ncbi:MAG: enoyl-CoA hydratase-related protein, partial [Bacteroidota bacterium]